MVFEDCPKQQSGKGTCCKQIPKQGHGKVFDQSTCPYGRKLAYRCMSQYQIEKYGSSQAHSGAHNENSTAGYYHSDEKTDYPSLNG